MVNLKLLPYVTSKFVVLGRLCIIQCVILLSIVHFGCGLKGNLVITFGIMLLASMVGVAIGLVLSAGARTTEIAIGLLPLVQLTMVVLGGGMQPHKEMPKVMNWAAQTMPSRWAFEGALLMEVKERPNYPVDFPAGIPAPKPIDMAEPLFTEEDRTSVLAALAALTIIFVLFSGSVLLILRLRNVH